MSDRTIGIEPAGTHPARVEVFVAPLASAPSQDPDGLPQEEIKRAGAMADPGARSRFCATRHLLRGALADYTGQAASELRIGLTIGGKPVLAEGGPAFSVAHSHAWCVIAISRQCPVGVDVEELSPRAGLEAVVEHFMPPAARSEILATRPRDRTEAALRWWVRLEAATKACDGVLERASVSLGRVKDEVAIPVPGVVVAVAGDTSAPLAVRWRLP